MEYTVNVEEAGTYDLLVPVASLEGGGRFRIWIGSARTSYLEAPRTNSWQGTRDVHERVELEAGEQVMKVQIYSEPAFNLDKFVFTNITSERDTEVGGLALYPNPAADRLVIDAGRDVGEGRLRVFSTEGRLVREQLVEGRKAELGLAGLARGLYLVKLHSGGDVLTGRFLKH
jgi:hypothetical protein